MTVAGSRRPTYETHRKNGTRPTNLEYSKALKNSLEQAGYSPEQVNELVRKAVKDRVKHGQLAGDLVPRIPGKINQKKRPE